MLYIPLHTPPAWQPGMYFKDEGVLKVALCLASKEAGVVFDT